MKALYNKGFPTPIPIDSNRHAIVMSHIKGYPLSQIKELSNAHAVYEQLLQQIIRLAEHGLVHGDFNEFNLMINDDEKITIIDFPQMTSTSHPNAQFYFQRDVVCIQEFFAKRFGLCFEGVPELAQDIEKAADLDREVKASGFNEDELKAMENIHELYLNEKGEIESSDEEIMVP
jgi:RIO kinase 2